MTGLPTRFAPLVPKLSFWSSFAPIAPSPIVTPPTIQELSVKYAGHVAFYLIYPIKSESSDQIRKHLLDFGYHVPAFGDPGLKLARAIQVSITPEAAVFSSARKLLYHGRIDDWCVEFTRARRAKAKANLTNCPLVLRP